jgi:hypothetical protein
MRFSWALLFLGACGFPQVTLGGSMMDATIDAEIDANGDASSAGDAKEAAPDAKVSECTTASDCRIACSGTTVNCTCAGYQKNDVLPSCDMACSLLVPCTGKMAVCTDAGLCASQ